MSVLRSICALMICVMAGAAGAFAGEIHTAVAAGDAERVAALIRSNPEVIHERAANAMRDLPLHTAALEGQVEIARLLLDAGADLEAGDTDNSTPLHDACVQGQREMVALLLERGADVNRRDYNAGYALSFAASGGDTAVVRMILDAGADLYFRNANGSSLLHYAAMRGLESLADSLLVLGEDVNARTRFGDTPLIWAAVRNQRSLAEMLLAHGAQPNLGNEHGETPLHRMAQRGNLEMGRLLLAWGANPRATMDGWGATPLHYTCWDGHAEFAQLLLGHGVDVNHNADRHLPLTMAIDHGHTGLVEVLLEAHADLDITEPDFGWTPLQQAAALGQGEIVEELLEHGATPASMRNGDSPQALAARYGHDSVVERLASRGARERLPDTRMDLADLTDLAEKEAVFWFLGHSGWGIRTKNHMLIFDYFERTRRPDQPGLCNGYIQPPELAGEDVMVLVSHDHGDHYDPRIWEWGEEIENITYVFGFQPEGDSLPAYELMPPRQTRTIDGVKITTIESNDSGVGFWVEVDGLTILHPGDHANRQRDFSGPYKAEIDWLAQRGVRPDIAFFPISGCGFGDLEAVKMGVHYALETLAPHAFFPMHAGDMSRRYAAFVDECRDQFPRTHMGTIRLRGDRFRYSQGNVAALAGRVD